MLPLWMVHAATIDRRARILDERDDRELLFHARQLAADIEPRPVLVEGLLSMRAPAPHTERAQPPRLA